MIKRTDERLELKPERLAADTAYGTGKFLHWVIGTGITPHIPVWDMSKREEGILSRADFTFDRQRDLYICPQGKFLRTTGTVLDGRTIVYRASTRDCGPCPLKPKCTPNMTFRKIPRDVHEDARDATRALMGTPEFVTSRNERKKESSAEGSKITHFKTSAPRVTTAGTICRRSAPAWPNGTSLCGECSPTRDCSGPQEVKTAVS